MVRLEIKLPKSKKYLKHFDRLKFKTVLDFLIELFSSNNFENSEADNHLFDLIKKLGFNRIEDIPEEIITELHGIHHDIVAQTRSEYDPEKEAYLLLSSLKSGILVLLVDTYVITDFDKPLSLSRDSIITFYESYIDQNNSFKTI